MLLKKKGVSPVIATVLLVSIVVVLSAVIFFWFRSFTKEAVIKFNKNIELVCPEVSLTAGYNSENGILSVANDGNVPVAELKIKIDSGGSRKTISITPQQISGGIKQGEAKEIFLEESGEIKSMIVIPVLKGAGNSGEKIYICEEKYGIEAGLK
jgi:flagellin-like protein